MSTAFAFWVADTFWLSGTCPQTTDQGILSMNAKDHQQGQTCFSVRINSATPAIHEAGRPVQPPRQTTANRYFLLAAIR
ncbi:hypothetical protein BJX65DRAFT_264235 [Aspergillus insuetus]